MKIFLDDLIFSLQRIGGISVYWSNFLDKVQRLEREDLILIRRSNGRPLFSDKIKWSSETWEEPKILLILTRLLPLLIKLPKGSLFHSSYLRYSIQPDVCNIVTIHDLASELGMVRGLRGKLKSYLQRSAVKNADGIICVSEATRKSLLNFYPFVPESKTKVIYHGFRQHFYRIKSRSTSRNILFVGERRGYKNFNVCYETMAKLKEYCLTIVGGEELSSTEIALLNRYAPGRYKHFKEVSTQVLNELYNESFCLIYPSCYEGFGMPVVEAMKAGCPVICGSNEAVKEIAGDAAIIVDDCTNTADFVKFILSLEDTRLREKMIEKGLEKSRSYNMEESFRQTIAFYHEIYQKKFDQKLVYKPKLAVEL